MVKLRSVGASCCKGRRMNPVDLRLCAEVQEKSAMSQAPMCGPASDATHAAVKKRLQNLLTQAAPD